MGARLRADAVQTTVELRQVKETAPGCVYNSHPMRNSHRHNAMARLALVAALLLAAVPTLGRLAPQVAQAAHAELMALCTADGLRYVTVSTLPAIAPRSTSHDHGTGQRDTLPDKPHDHGAPDCAYCPLLLSLLAAGCWLLWLRAASAHGLLLPLRVSSPRTFTHPCGLGSRGPPCAGSCLLA